MDAIVFGAILLVAVIVIVRMAYETLGGDRDIPIDYGERRRGGLHADGGAGGAGGTVDERHPDVAADDHGGFDWGFGGWGDGGGGGAGGGDGGGGGGGDGGG
jgi:hypothetical protein